MIKNKRKFLVRFHGEKEVEAYTQMEAQETVKSMKNIKARRGITTNSICDTMAQGFVMNISCIVATGLTFLLIHAWFRLLGLVSTIQNEGIRAIGLLIALVVMTTTLHLPKTISRYFDNRRY